MKQLFFFSANWCEHCQHMNLPLDQIKSIIPVEKIDVDYETDRTHQAKIQKVPTIVLAQNGNEIKRYTGTMSYEQLKNWING